MLPVLYVKSNLLMLIHFVGKISFLQRHSLWCLEVKIWGRFEFNMCLTSVERGKTVHLRHLVVQTGWVWSTPLTYGLCHHIRFLHLFPNLFRQFRNITFCGQSLSGSHKLLSQSVSPLSPVK